MFGKSKKNPFESSVPSQEEVTSDPRFAELSEEKKEMLIRALRMRRQFPGKKPGSAEAVAEQNRRFKEFAFGYLGLDAVPLERYGANPSTFPKDRYRLVLLTASHQSAYDPASPYGARDGDVLDQVSRRGAYIDSPLALRLLYRHDKEVTRPPSEMEQVAADIFGEGEAAAPPPPSEWEPISIVSFVPDFEKNVLLIDQIQGGDTFGGQMTADARRSRMKFENNSPEQALVEMLRDFAKGLGMRGIGVRKAERNTYDRVKLVAKRGMSTRYSEVAAANNMRGFTGGDYYIELFD